MKKLLILFVAIIPFLSYGQYTPTENYTSKTTYTTPVVDGSQDLLNDTLKIRQVTYYDRMGRAIQNIAVNAGGAKQEVISHYEYDAAGRQAKSYLPYAANVSNPLGYDATIKNSIAPFYQAKYASDFQAGITPNPYAETIYEKSPLGTPLKQGAPGTDWRIKTDDTDHTVKMEYKTNIDTDVLNFDVEFTAGDFLQPTLAYKGFYKKDELYVTITKNENWKTADGKLNTTETYKNKQGQTLLVRTFDKISTVTTPHNLYYVYDDFGNVTFVLSPKASESLVLTPIGLPNFTQNVPFTDLLTYTPVGTLPPPTGTVAVISLVGTNELKIAFNFQTTKSRNLKTGVLFPISTPVADCVLGTLTYIAAEFKISIVNNNLVVTDIGGTPIPAGTNVNATLTVFLPTESTLAPLPTDLLNDLAYQYRYDYKNRAVEKKIPGKGWESYVYDVLNRPILTQDANLKLTNKWLFVKYDKLGRTAYKGEYTDSRTRAVIQAEIDALSNPVLFESKTATAFSNGVMNINYTYAAYPPTTSGVSISSVNYYDDYTYGLVSGIAAPPSTVYSQPVTSNTRALATVSNVRILGVSNQWTTTTVAYDEKARAIWTKSKNEYLDTSDVLEVKLDHVGNPVEAKTVHNKPGITTNLTTFDYFKYDHRLRLLKHTQKIMSANPVEELITYNKYDELGQLVQKKVGGANGVNSALQTVDFTTNVRGWLTKINDLNSMGTDLFAFEIKHNTPTAGGTTPLYNGNISQTLWKTASADSSLKKYSYSYDNLNRLKEAKFSKTDGAIVTNDTHNEIVSYDKNGNIATLQRSGFKDATTFLSSLDVLSYTYKGNRLLEVVDTGSPEGFKDVTPTLPASDYSYDDIGGVPGTGNGNLTKDLNKNITAITYNYFNLPLRITFGTGIIIDFVYDAMGTKLSKKVTNGAAFTKTQYAGNYIYKEVASGTTLECFSQPEGYVAVNAGTYKYVYQYKDHLGNVRLNYTKNTSGALEIIEENNYYPFGVKHKGYNPGILNSGNSTANKFKFNGQEYDDDLSVTEMDFRQYDGAIGRFYGIDLLAEATPWATPNHFALNNPVIGSDPTGLLLQAPDMDHQPQYYAPDAPGSFMYMALYSSNGPPGEGVESGNSSFHSMVQNYAWGNGTGFSSFSGGIGGINGATPKHHVDGQGGHYINIKKETINVAYYINLVTDVDGNKSGVFEPVNIEVARRWVADENNPPGFFAALGFGLNLAEGVRQLKAYQYFGASMKSVEKALKAGKYIFKGDLYWQGNYKGITKLMTNSLKSAEFLKQMGKGMQFVGTGISIYQFAVSDHNGSDYARLGGAGIILAANYIPEAGPFISIALGTADGAGAFDSFYNSFN